MHSPHLPIKTVAERTGLSAHVIRVWERRYGAVTPRRTATNRRVYSNEDVERFTLLKKLTLQGHSIGHVAKLQTDQLERLASESMESATRRSGTRTPAYVPATAEALIEQCISAVRKLEARELQSSLTTAETQFGVQGMLQRVIAPLAHHLGELWREGIISAAHEHFASAVLRTILGQAIRPFASSEQSPVILLATPSGQLHELGALIAAALASNLGWKVVYLGASLPAAEIAGAARSHHARVVGLSIVYPTDDSRLEPDLLKLRELLPADTRIVAGGRAASAYRNALDTIHALRTESLDQFGQYLDHVRTSQSGPGATFA